MYYSAGESSTGRDKALQYRGVRRPSPISRGEEMEGTGEEPPTVIAGLGGDGGKLLEGKKLAHSGGKYLGGKISFSGHIYVL